MLGVREVGVKMVHQPGTSWPAPIKRNRSEQTLLQHLTCIENNNTDSNGPLRRAQSVPCLKSSSSSIDQDTLNVAELANLLRAIGDYLDEPGPRELILSVADRVVSDASLLNAMDGEQFGTLFQALNSQLNDPRVQSAAERLISHFAEDTNLQRSMHVLHYGPMLKYLNSSYNKLDKNLQGKVALAMYDGFARHPETAPNISPALVNQALVIGLSLSLELPLE